MSGHENGIGHGGLDPGLELLLFFHDIRQTLENDFQGPRRFSGAHHVDVNLG
jgi:hypothetical protein